MAHTTPQTGEPGNPYEGTAWFTWTAPASGPATFTTAAGPADIPLDVYTGSQLATLTWVAMSQYDSARRGYVATFDAVAGTTYRIRTKGAVVGTQQLTWNRPAGESELPVAEMAYPDPGALVRGVAFLDATVFDRRGIERVDFLAGGTVIAAGSIGYGHASGYWDTRERPDGPVDVTARAVDRWGNAATSQPVRVVVDNTAPRTAIATGPTGTVTSRTARFTFSAGETAAAWSCRLDRYAWRPCAAAVTISKLSDGPHALEVRAEDLAGNIDFTPARRLWSVSGGEAQPAGAPVLAAARVR
jgi:hypothetical protein